MDENRRCGFLREGECGLLCGAGDNPRVYYKGGKRVRVRVCVYSVGGWATLWYIVMKKVRQ